MTRSYYFLLHRRSLKVKLAHKIRVFTCLTQYKVTIFLRTIKFQCQNVVCVRKEINRRCVIFLDKTVAESPLVSIFLLLHWKIIDITNKHVSPSVYLSYGRSTPPNSCIHSRQFFVSTKLTYIVNNQFIVYYFTSSKLSSQILAHCDHWHFIEFRISWLEIGDYRLDPLNNSSENKSKYICTYICSKVYVWDFLLGNTEPDYIRAELNKINQQPESNVKTIHHSKSLVIGHEIKATSLYSYLTNI